ncbi:NADPH:quinone oxidoreductase family protein [Catenuloplanes atrovinosus]|uniref:NADPH2:quinone reductase n=1 Tax=Catenuloplanes atrovinosus TaxID=137266 RepID=A0AAE4C7M2_9ACTN|nr:NADPH:quinone oxidoreductase family protein [Catenuloplanes atrovinosus]MDR7274676.1 NADPH2:quinone reductase [Catenuloplanes atrovinosus]
MRAWQVHETGDLATGPRLAGDVPRPVPGPGQTLLRVRACALNFPDALLVQGRYQERPPLPFTPGIELCGEVADPGGTGLRVGDRVVGGAALPHGALAEYALADARFLYPAPPELDDVKAAAYFVAYQTGWVGLHTRARLRPGETLLVHAAAGGVGSAAIQLGKAAGARVIGVTGGPEKARIARERGADEVVDRTACDDLGAALKEACGPGGADVVYDPVGGAAFAASTKAVAFEGRIVVVGFASGDIPRAAANHALVKNYSVVGLHWGLYRSRRPEVVHEAAAALAELAAKGAIDPYVSRVLPLDRAVEGLTALAGGETTGRVVIEP